ncbi:MAG: hypothetical protein LBU11_02215, partial [Zoogloeaceae bacterium]|nr:hypothetical protein [Zoogloeaceae bacterium]
SAFGKTYDYLLDGHLRAKELGRQRISINNADFTDIRIRDTSWQYIDFIDCEFSGLYTIHLEWLTDSTFKNCHFKGHFGLGHARDVKFINCTVDGESTIAFFSKSTGLVFEGSEFLNPNGDPNHQGFISSKNEMTLINCKARNFAWGGHNKLSLKNCKLINGSLDTAYSGEYSDKSKMPYSDFLLEDCDFTGGVSMINPKLNSLILRNCKLGVFQTEGSIVRGDVLAEGIKEGHLNLSASKFQGKLMVRNCSFYRTYDGYSFRCGGCVPTHTLLENIDCSSSPTDVTSTFGPRKEWKDPPPNKLFIIRNCKIPHLKVDWAQTEHLRIENCKFNNLDIKNGRIGKLEIIGCTLVKLDVSNTQVKTHDVRVPEGDAECVTTGSNIARIR